MGKPILTLSPKLVRRLAITRQHLAGPRPSADGAGILETLRDLRCLQLDPISAVARSPLLVLWSRLGQYKQEALDDLLWQQRQLFEYWAHEASIVLTEDYPIHAHWMRSRGTRQRPWPPKFAAWLAENTKTKSAILTELRRSGPLLARDLSQAMSNTWRGSPLPTGTTISHVLYSLWLKGKVLVARRTGGHRVWDLGERCLPDWTPRERLAQAEVVRRSTEHALRAMGVATAGQIKEHFTRRGYPQLEKALKALQRTGQIEPVAVHGDGAVWPGAWYIHSDDLPLLERIDAGEWKPRTTLLSPFDNLICDRKRTRQLFNFDFALEIYKPKAKRKHGYYVLPILHGDRLIGRMDLATDRQRQVLEAKAVYAEADAPTGKAVVRGIARALRGLSRFVGVRAVDCSSRMPAGWEGLKS